MAIVQVSRITNRKGLAENLPQLAGAELGWCVDTRRLFIGNGTLQEGAPTIGNTEILTEYTDLSSTIPYTYSDIVVGYPAQTGPSASDPVVRTVQAKLDDFASVRDFGATGDGVTDDTEAINRALNQLYCQQTNTEIRRTLYFPAGSYRITESIVIPTYAKLVGEGANCTIIVLDTSADISSLSAYVARFGDSLQQTGASIGSNGATAPRNIEISSISFRTVEVTDVFLVEDATQCYFDSCGFTGPITQTNIINDGNTDNIAGVRFNSTASFICNQITFDKCFFSGLIYGINTDEQIQSVTVSNSRFTTLFQGIVLGDGTPINGGAKGFRAVGNLFNSIYRQGIVYGDVSQNISAHNIFLDVGNEYTISAVTSCIRFDYDNNVSYSDMFERTDAAAVAVQRIEITGGAVSSNSQLTLGRYSRLSGVTTTLVNNTSSYTTIVTVSLLDIKAFRMDYTITRGTEVRHGTLLVAYNTSTSTTNDTYAETGSTGVTFGSTVSGSTVLIRYITTNTGSDATLTYSLAHLA